VVAGVCAPSGEIFGELPIAHARQHCPQTAIPAGLVEHGELGRAICFHDQLTPQRADSFSAWLRTSIMAGEAAGHEGDHGPVDHGFVVGGEAFVVAGAASVASDPGQGPLDHPPAGAAPGRLTMPWAVRRDQVGSGASGGRIDRFTWWT
jgi:hypothetical protein